ncbi:transmembrane protein, putative [Medicago truncatula]|uniref:Transmembrane protein, putative n=1 Tax=Medicago truncatula TaxID=3880 RepID=A0A072ULA9_MEDTR|nr:transmembrane protein, putative [Medicago truncatula]
MKDILPVEVIVPSIGVPLKSKLKQSSNKKVRPRIVQGRDFVPKKVLPFQLDSRGKWTPNYEGSCAMTFTTMDGNKLARPMNASAVKKYFVKNKNLEQGHSKLLRRKAVIVFNVPSNTFTIFQIFQRSVEHCHWQVTTQFIKFELVPIYLELSFILFAKFLLFFMTILKAKNFKNTKLFFTSFEKCEQQTHSLRTRE